MSKYIMRLDDAAPKMDIVKWSSMEQLLDKYNVKPLVGVIPNCKDPNMKVYSSDEDFWIKVYRWIDKGWTIALHGYEHVYCTENGGINPINNRSEFAGLLLKDQKKKIRAGVEIFRSHGIEPEIFFAPSHTYDLNTLEALKTESKIRIISDTVANKPYYKYGFTFVPQQSGKVRKLPFDTVTFCYHPNMMSDEEFLGLETFLKKNKEKFIDFPLKQETRQYGLLDKLLEGIYFKRRQWKRSDSGELKND